MLSTVSFRMRARGGTAFSQTEVFIMAIVSLLSPPTAGADRYHIGITINLANTIFLNLVYP